jgi:hypothetical protein
MKVVSRKEAQKLPIPELTAEEDDDVGQRPRPLTLFYVQEIAQ